MQVAADGVEFGGAGVVGGGEVFECPAVEVGVLVAAVLLNAAALLNGAVGAARSRSCHCTHFSGTARTCACSVPGAALSAWVKLAGM